MKEIILGFIFIALLMIAAQLSQIKFSLRESNSINMEARTKDSLYREANTRLINHKNKCNCVCL